MEDAATDPAAVRPHEVLGRTIAGKFKIVSFLGGGAMGAVYKARQVALDKDVAIKLLNPEHAGDATFAARFQREAKAASKLDHPNSVRVLDFGQEPDGLLYIAMEFLDGRDLFHVIREDWPISTKRAADVLIQALAAIAVAHDMGVVHRDLKPENIMLMRGTDDEGDARDVVKVCDFGIAKFTEPGGPRSARGPKLTTQGLVVGTPEYMSPEQGKGEALDARSDLYSVGVILYQLLTGRVPFDAETALGVVLKHVTEEPPPPRALNPGADPRLETICLKAMRKKRDERYQSARDMRADLRAAIGATDPMAHAATAQLHSVAPEAHAPTALALDSGAVIAATASKLTPAGTVTDSQPLPAPSRRGPLVVALVAVLLAGAAAVAWKAYPRASAPPLVVLAATQGVPSAPPTTLEPIRAQNSELPPLEPTIPSAATPTKTAALPPSPGRTGATPPPPVTVAAPATTAVIAAPPPATTAPPAPSAAPPPAVPTVTAAAPPGQAPPAAAPFDASRAHVDWSVAGAGGGATPGAVQRALSRTAGGWTQCYRTALARRSERVEGGGVLHLTTDESGNVVGASIRGFDTMPAVKSCIAGSARVHIDGVDTGDAWADVQLTFRAE